MTTIASVSYILSLRSGKRKHSDFQTLPCVIRVRLSPPGCPGRWLLLVEEEDKVEEEEDVFVDDVYRTDALFFRLEI